MTKKEFFTIVDSKLGNYKDNYGNWKVVGTKKTYRIKPQYSSFRLEVLNPVTKNWSNLSWGKTQYYKNITEERVNLLCDKLLGKV